MAQTKNDMEKSEKSIAKHSCKEKTIIGALRGLYVFTYLLKIHKAGLKDIL
jgi:hypothetical protein